MTAPARRDLDPANPPEPATGVHRIDRAALARILAPVLAPPDPGPGPPTTGGGPTAAPAPACPLCDGSLGAKPVRGCCQTCWRKWKACGLELPPPSPPGPRARDPLLSALDRLSPTQRLKALAHLAALAAPEAPGPEDPAP